MANVTLSKVVATLPAEPDPNTIYFVRVGTGFDLYVGSTRLNLDWTDMEGKPPTFVPSAHNHTIADVAYLQGELDSFVRWGDLWNYSPPIQYITQEDYDDALINDDVDPYTTYIIVDEYPDMGIA